MANTQTSVPLFVANTVLTAAQQNISAGTGVPVFATTVTRDAAFGGSNKALAEGQLCYIEASNVVQYYDGAAWATVGPASAGALTLIATASPSAVASVSFNSCFSATYANYLILANFTAGVGANAGLTMRLRVSGTDATTNYNQLVVNAESTPTVSASATFSTTSFPVGNIDPTYNVSVSQMTLFDPFTTSKTLLNATSQQRLSTGRYDQRTSSAYHSDATSYDGFTIITSGTSFTGTIRVYGYSNS